MRKIAIVDICGTLFNSNTTFDFLRSQFPEFDTLSKNSWLKLANKITTKFLNTDFIRAIGIKKLRGLSKIELKDKGKAFYDDYLSTRETKEVILLIDDLKSEGYKIILVSGTMDFIANEVAERINADAVYSTSLAYAGDICKGMIETDLLGNKHRILDQIENQLPGKILVYTITDNKTDAILVNRSDFKCIVSSARDIPYWKKAIKDEFRLIEV